jgi:hypothetical protein
MPKRDAELLVEDMLDALRKIERIRGISCQERRKALVSSGVAHRACRSSVSDNGALCHLKGLPLDLRRIIRRNRAAGCGFCAHPYPIAAQTQ